MPVSNSVVIHGLGQSQKHFQWTIVGMGLMLLVEEFHGLPFADRFASPTLLVG